MTERPSPRRSTSWVLPGSGDEHGAREPPATPAAEEAGTPAPATPHTAMNRLGWTQEQVEARKAL
eukprot:10036603-Alexandrium_andersonii.AAC.1